MYSELIYKEMKTVKDLTVENSEKLSHCPQSTCTFGWDILFVAPAEKKYKMNQLILTSAISQSGPSKQILGIRKAV